MRFGVAGLRSFPHANFTQAYVRYWMRFHSDMEAKHAVMEKGTWVMVTEWKEPNNPEVDTGGSNNWRTNVTLRTFQTDLWWDNIVVKQWEPADS